MSSGLLTNPDLVLADLTGLAARLYPALEEATRVATEWFEERNEPIEPHHFASTVRYVAKRQLVSVGQNVEYDMADSPNNGLRVAFDRYSIRVRKIDRRVQDDVIVLAPSPGDSSALQSFYSQQGSLFILDPHSVAPHRPWELNLLILWDLSPGYVDLFVSCPRFGADSRKSVREHWWRPLPNPATASGAGSGGGSGGSGDGPGPIGYEPPDASEGDIAEA